MPRCLLAVYLIGVLGIVYDVAAQDAAMPQASYDGYMALLAERGKRTDAQRFEQIVSLYLAEGGDEPPNTRTVDDRKALWLTRSAAKAGAKTRRNAARLDVVRSIDPKGLSPAAQLDWRLLRHIAASDVELDKFPIEHLWVEWPEDDYWFRIEPLPANTAVDYQVILSWLRGLKLTVDESLHLLRQGAAKGITVAKDQAGAVLKDLGELVPEEPLDSPYLAAFKRFPPTVPEPERQALLNEAQQVYRTQIKPAFKAYRTYLQDTYIPAARPTGAMHALPNGKAWYAALVRSSTGVTADPEQVHQSALGEVARLSEELASLARGAGFEGSFADFIKKVRSDPRCAPLEASTVVPEAHKILNVVAPHLPKLFSAIPKIPFEIQAVQSLPPGAAGAQAMGGSLKDGRPGRILIQTPFPNGCGFPNVVLHEGLPGHILQFHLTAESSTMSDLRRRAWHPAFSEGWAHYASGLSTELGLTPDAYTRAERGTGEMFMAVRAVIETGLHWKGWTPEEAASYFKTTLPWAPHGRVQNEVDAALRSPGGRLAYLVGQQKILELRTHAERELGARFDIRAFHDELLGNGQLPLRVLDEHIRQWVAARKR